MLQTETRYMDIPHTPTPTTCPLKRLCERFHSLKRTPWCSSFVITRTLLYYVEWCFFKKDQVFFYFEELYKRKQKINVHFLYLSVEYPLDTNSTFNSCAIKRSLNITKVYFSLELLLLEKFFQFLLLLVSCVLV